MCSLDLGLEEKSCERRLLLDEEGLRWPVFSEGDMAEEVEKGFWIRRGMLLATLRSGNGVKEAAGEADALGNRDQRRSGG